MDLFFDNYNALTSYSWTCLFWQSLQSFVNKHLSKLSLDVADLDSQVYIMNNYNLHVQILIAVVNWMS